MASNSEEYWRQVHQAIRRHCNNSDVEDIYGVDDDDVNANNSDVDDSVDDDGVDDDDVDLGNVVDDDVEDEDDDGEVFVYTEKCWVPRKVTSVQFHPSVVEVEDNAFEGNTRLRKVVFNEGLQKIGWSAFRYCPSLTSIMFPTTVLDIGGDAFRDCFWLERVVLNHGLQKIGNCSFFGCSSLSTIIIPSTVTEIDSKVFHGCLRLRMVVLNEGLQKIGNCSFYGCTSLSSITLPSTVTDIGSMAFNGCRYISDLREVRLLGLPRKIAATAFCGCTSLETFLFPTITNRVDVANQKYSDHWGGIEDGDYGRLGSLGIRGGVMSVSFRRMGGGRLWNAVRRDLVKFIRIISFYELKEATSLFELAFWKFKLEQVDKANPILRKKCRMDVPGPVKDTILQYLPHECLLPV